jgi:flagellar hook-length control protein FliK
LYMQSSSTQNQGSLGSLLALSPQSSPSREPYSPNASDSFGNTFESARQDVRQNLRQQERQELASANADRASRTSRDAAARERAAPERPATERPEVNRSEATSAVCAQVRKGDDANNSSSGTATAMAESRSSEARKEGQAESSKESPTTSSTPLVPGDATSSDVDAGLLTDDTLFSPLADETSANQALSSALSATNEDTESALLLEPDAALDELTPLLPDGSTAPAVVDADDSADAADESLLAALGSPLMVQMLAKTTASTDTETAIEGDGDAIADSLLAKPPGIKTMTNGQTELAAAAQGKQGDIPLEASTKELFARLLAGQTDVRERALPLSAQAAPALDAISRAVESLPPAGRGFVVQSGVAVPLGQPQWSQAVGDRVLWLAAQNISSAELRLDPPELGPMQVRVSVQQDQVQVTFTSPHANVREALDQGASRLREMFNEQGLNVNVEVSDQAHSRRQEGGEGSGRRGRESGDEPSEEVVAETSVANIRLVDHYA